MLAGARDALHAFRFAVAFYLAVTSISHNPIAVKVILWLFSWFTMLSIASQYSCYTFLGYLIILILSATLSPSFYAWVIRFNQVYINSSDNQLTGYPISSWVTTAAHTSDLCCSCMLESRKLAVGGVYLDYSTYSVSSIVVSSVQSCGGKLPSHEIEKSSAMRMYLLQSCLPVTAVAEMQCVRARLNN